MSQITDKTFNEIQIGDKFEARKVFLSGDLRAFAHMSGNIIPLPDDESGTKEGVALLAAWFAAAVESGFPGPGSSVTSVAVKTEDVLPFDREVRALFQVKAKNEALQSVSIEVLCLNQSGKTVAGGILEVKAPLTKQTVNIPDYSPEKIFARCQGLKPVKTGVVHPCSKDALEGAVEAGKYHLIEPVLYGPEAEIRKIAAEYQADLTGCMIINTSGAEESAAKAAAAAGAGEVQALMKGSLHTDVLLHAVMQSSSGLKTGRLLSHCALLAVPTYGRSIIVTDVALNIAPTTDQKKDICQNAIGFAKALGRETPKVAVLAAVETVNSKMPATLDGAILAKMADRRQIVGGIVDGPLDLDAAVDRKAAEIKQIVSPVVGEADILLVPNIEAGNMIYKNLTFMADAQMAGLVVGAKVPIILTSRADTVFNRRFSAAVALLYADAAARDPEILAPKTAE